MNFAYWSPVFGTWLRNVDNDSTQCSWDYIKSLALEAEDLGYVLTLVPELYLNDIKGHNAPCLDAWAVATALAACTKKIQILAALRPQYHQIALTAKELSTLAQISNYRFSVNLVSAWWEEEARQYGIQFDAHDERYELLSEYAQVLKGFWTKTPFSHKGRFFEFKDSYNEPKPQKLPFIYAGGESDKGREAIAKFADFYLMHGGTPQEIKEKIEDMKARKAKAGLDAFKGFGMAAYVILRDTEEEALKELERITTIKNENIYANSYKDFTSNSNLNVDISKEEYSVSNRGLRPRLVGTAEQIAQKVKEYEQAGLNLIIIQCANMKEELRNIATKLFPLLK